MQQQREVIKKFYVFDRDETFLKDGDELINPEFTIPFFELLAQAPGVRYAIASKGGVMVEADPGLVALREAGANLQRLPAYSKYGVTSLGNAMQEVHGVTYDGPDARTIAINTFNNGEAWLAATPQVPVPPVAADGKWHIFEGNEKRHNRDKPITISPDTVWTARFYDTLDKNGKPLVGRTIMKVRAREFYENFVAYYKGDCKIIAIFQALDEAKLKIRVTPALQSLGFIEINAPEDYQEIDPADIVFTDDRPDNCAYVRLAGMTAIHADTSCSKHNGDATHFNTYIKQLMNTLSPELKERFYRIRETRQWNVSVATLLGRAKSANELGNYSGAKTLYKIAFLKANEVERKNVLSEAVAAAKEKISTKEEKAHDNDAADTYLRKCLQDGGLGIAVRLLEFDFAMHQELYKPADSNLFMRMFQSASFTEEAVTRWKGLVLQVLEVKSIMREPQGIERAERLLSSMTTYASQPRNQQLSTAFVQAVEAFTSRVAAVSQQAAASSSSSISREASSYSK